MGLIDTLLNPILQPLVGISVFWGIVTLSLCGALLSTLANKYFSDQNEIKRLKDEQKQHQQKMKESRNNPEEMISAQKHMSRITFELLRHSFKPMLITLIPFWLLFIWMNAHLAYVPIAPGQEFTVTAMGAPGMARIVAPQQVDVIGDAQKKMNGTVDFTLKASDVGTYFIDIEHDGEIYTKDVVVSTEQLYADKEKVFKDKPLQSVTIQYSTLYPLGETSLFGWTPGWLGWYIIFSIGFGLLLRKVFKLQ